ncbi:MAG: acyltransferase family protein, partial [Solirubrobacteraceae bacterium]
TIGGAAIGHAPTAGTLAVGESVMLAARPALLRALGHGTVVDAAIDRQPDEIISRLDAYRRAGTLPQRVVVQLGDNGPLWSADAAHLRTALKGVAHVVLVNVRVPRSWEGEVNDQLRQLVSGWPQATIADWYDASSDPSLLYDGIHPDPAGQRAYARVIARALSPRPRAR